MKLLSDPAIAGTLACHSTKYISVETDQSSLYTAESVGPIRFSNGPLFLLPAWKVSHCTNGLIQNRIDHYQDLSYSTTPALLFVPMTLTDL